MNLKMTVNNLLYLLKEKKFGAGRITFSIVITIALLQDMKDFIQEP